MKKLCKNISFFSVLLLVAFQNLQATSSSSETSQHFQKPQKLLLPPSFEFIQEASQRIKDYWEACNTMPDSIKKINLEITRINLEEIKHVASTMMPGDDMFDRGMTLLLKIFPEDLNFDPILQVARERGESDLVTSTAQFNLATMYGWGIGCIIDRTKAKELYKKAANRGHADAQFVMAYDYIKWRNAPIEEHLEAFNYFKAAAEQGHHEAQSCLADMYINAKCIENDLDML